MIASSPRRAGKVMLERYSRLAGCEYMVRTEPVRETLFGAFYVLQEVNKL